MRPSGTFSAVNPQAADLGASAPLFALVSGIALSFPELEARPRRMAAIKPTHTIRGLALDVTLRLLHRVAGATAVATAREAAGVTEPSFSALRNYPLGEYMRLAFAAAELLVPACGSLERALALVGGATVEVFFESVAGKTMKLLANNEPHRLFTAAVTAYPIAIADEARYTYDRLGDRTGVFHFAHELLGPLHHIGVFEAATRQACHVELQVELEQLTEFDYAIRVAW